MRTSGIGRSLGAGLASVLIASAEGQYSIDGGYPILSSDRHYSENSPLILPETASLGERLTITGAIGVSVSAGLYGIGRAAWRYTNKPGSHGRRLTR